MAVTPESLLDAARSIGKGTGEVDSRNAVSRAYYAAYHRCLAVAQDARRPIAESGGVHVALIQALTDPLAPTRFKSLGYMLEQCRLRRVDADYRINQDFPRDIADTVLANCARILRKADDIDDG